MIRKNEIAVINVYLNGHQIDKVYSGQIQVYPDQQIENNFWLKVTNYDNTVVYCWCRQLSATETNGVITSITYEVIQTQTTAPDSEYYELTKEIYIADSATDYTSVLTTNGMDPDQVYDIIPQINQKLIIDDTRHTKWSKGLQLSGFNDWSLGLDVHDYDEFILTAQVSKYEGDGLFGCNSSNDNMDFRIFLYPNANIAFDCGSGRAQYTSFSSTYAYKIWTAHMKSGQNFYVEQTINGTTKTYNSNTSLNFANYTGDSELKLCPTVSWQSAQYEPFVFYELKCLNNGVLLHDFVIYEDDLSLSSTNRLYDTVTKQFLTHPSLSFNLVTNSYTITEGEIVYSKGNILDDFSLDSTMYNQEINKTTYYYNNVIVSDSLNNMDYVTGAKYVDHVVYQTSDPTIFYDQTTFRVQAYGDGTVKLYVNNTEVSNPYTFTQNASDTSYTVSATAKEDGKAISDTVTQSITVSGYQTDMPTISFSQIQGTVTASGNGTITLYIDGTQVSNPYTLPGYGDYTATATAQESGKQLSDTTTLPIEYIETRYLYKYGLYINDMEGVYFGAGQTTDYDTIEFFFRPVSYGGASWFGVMNAPGDNNDFRLFGASSNIYFDCGSGRINKTRITDSYMLQVKLVSGGFCTQAYWDGDYHQSSLGTSVSFSSYTGSSKDILLGANPLYFYGFDGWKNGQLIDSIIVPESYVEQGIYNVVYNTVTEQYITLSKTPATYETNPCPEGYPSYTEDPTISYDETTMRVQAYGNGTVNLYIDGTQVQNPYLFTQPEQTTSYTVTATAKESGKLISNTVSQTITIEGSSAPSETTVQITIAEMVSEFGWTNSTDNVKDTDWTINGVTFRFEKGTNTTTPKYYSTGGGAIRLYANNTMSISAGTSIKKVTIAVNGATYKFVAGDNSQGTMTYDETVTSTAIFDFGNGVQTASFVVSTSTQRRPNNFIIEYLP